MSEEIIKVLDDLGERFGIAIDWTSQNVMPYLQDLASRYIVYKNLIAAVEIVIAIVLITSGIVCIIKLKKWGKSDTFDENYFSEDKDNFFGGMLGSLSLVVTGVCLIIGNVMGIIQNVCMPEIIILNYIKTLI